MDVVYWQDLQCDALAQAMCCRLTLPLFLSVSLCLSLSLSCSLPHPLILSCMHACSCTHAQRHMHPHSQCGRPAAPTLQPCLPAGTANGPMPAIMSAKTSPGWKLPTNRLCSVSSREFQYTWQQCAGRQAGPWQSAGQGNSSRQLRECTSDTHNSSSP